MPNSNSLHEPVDDLADPVLEFEELPLALGVADPLDNYLFGRLRGDAAKIDRRQRVGDEVADLGLGVQPLSIRQRDLRRLVFDDIGHLAKPQQPDLAVVAVDFGADIVILAVFGAARLLDRLLHRLQDFVAIDPLVARDGVGDLQQFRAGIGDGAVHRVLEFYEPVVLETVVLERVAWGISGFGTGQPIAAGGLAACAARQRSGRR